MATSYFLMPGADGAPLIPGSTPDGTIPPGAVGCTEEQAQNPSAYSISNGQIVDAPEAQLVKAAQTSQMASVAQSYAQAISQPVTYTTAAGVEKTYDADPASQNLITQAFTLYSAAGAVPEGFYWVAADNTQVPLTLADLKALGMAVGTQVWSAFQNLQTKKVAILAATTVAEVQAVTW